MIFYQNESQFGPDQFILAVTTSFWSRPNHYGQVQIKLVRPKPFWTDQNCFGHLKGQAISVFILPQNSFTHQSSKVEGQKGSTNQVSNCVQNTQKNSSFHFENWSKQMQQTGTHVMSKQYSTGLLSNTGNSARNAKPVMLKNF